jgi:ParB family chromosome partitioning protein
MDNLDLLSLNAPDRVAQASGAPMQLPLDLVDEDPDQPRVEFDTEELQELAESIKERGVIAPISVRPHPKEDGRWIVNFGARRLRASRMAGRSLIPAFIDRGFNSYDQVIENEQRAGLKPLELAMFIKRELDKGLSRADISRRLGKSKTYVTYACAMIDPPDWLMEAYRAKRCTGLKELYELRRLREVSPAEVDALLQGSAAVSRKETTILVDQIAAAQTGEEGASAAIPVRVGRPRTTPVTASRISPTAAAGRSPIRATAELEVTAQMQERLVRVLIDAVPPTIDQVFVTTDGGQTRKAVAIAALADIRLSRS